MNHLMTKYEKSFGESWVALRENHNYKNYTMKNSNVKYSTGEMNMEMELHNQLNTEYGKTLNTVSFFTKSALSKFSKKDKWKLEIWLDEKDPQNHSGITCGLALRRANKGTIYVRKKAVTLNEAIKKSINVLERSIRREK
jgi:hypothetical protein